MHDAQFLEYELVLYCTIGSNLPCLEDSSLRLPPTAVDFSESLSETGCSEKKLDRPDRLNTSVPYPFTIGAYITARKYAIVS